MKELIAFVITWILFWLLITSIGWFINPGIDFRVMAGNTTVGYISIFLGWIPATVVAIHEYEKKKN